MPSSKNWNQGFKSLTSIALARLDEYTESTQLLRNPILLPYTMILDGAAHCSHPRTSRLYRDAQRLMQESKTNGTTHRAGYF
jgi:hypothetical protein